MKSYQDLIRSFLNLFLLKNELFMTLNILFSDALLTNVDQIGQETQVRFLLPVTYFNT